MPHSVLRAASIRYDVARAVKKEKKLQREERRLKRRRHSVSNGDDVMHGAESELPPTNKLNEEGKSSGSSSSSSCRANQPNEEHSSSSTVPVQGDLLRQKLLLEGLEGELTKDISFAVEQGYMPMANIANIVQSVLPDGAGSIGKCFKLTLQDCISEFLMLVTHLAAQRCSREGRRIMLAEDILWALDQAGLCQYRSTLRLFLGKLREHLKKCKKTSTEMVESLEAPPELLEIENGCSSLPNSSSMFPMMPMSPTEVMSMTATSAPPDHQAHEKKQKPAAAGIAEATMQAGWLDEDDDAISMGCSPSLPICCNAFHADEESYGDRCSSVPSVLHISIDRQRLSKSYSGASPSPSAQEGSVRSLVSQSDGRRWSEEIFERKYSTRRLERAE
ncbi:hypothetical protein FOL47_007697 [Perkinsus chesapeaki]|uniref:Transcription factor CBF/NF-Y/archaeal histone domain-containing protein n=1 Tax=Perkinsus chesapeaki TaxID=330153 RepID=A0A7J6LIR7_PERCH|nr:hypothetical protein FOL47_007697 [Perkinsus chesapeaki]